MAEDVSLLACKAKDNPALMLPLWDAVRRLVGLWASKYYGHIKENGTGAFEIDDLVQSGYLALVDAVAGYNPENEAGAEFTTYLRFEVRRQFAKVTGHYGTKKRPEHYSTSLEMPLAGFENITLGMRYQTPPQRLRTKWRGARNCGRTAPILWLRLKSCQRNSGGRLC